MLVTRTPNPKCLPPPRAQARSDGEIGVRRRSDKTFFRRVPFFGSWPVALTPGRRLRRVPVETDEIPSTVLLGGSMNDLANLAAQVAFVAGSLGAGGWGPASVDGQFGITRE